MKGSDRVIKISKFEAFQGMNEIDFKVYDYEIDMIQNWAIDNGHKVDSQFYLDHNNTILINFYDEFKNVVHSLRFQNKGTLTETGKKAIDKEKGN